MCVSEGPQSVCVVVVKRKARTALTFTGCKLPPQRPPYLAYVSMKLLLLAAVVVSGRP